MTRFVPLILVALVAIVAAWRLSAPASDGITSQLVGRQVPALELPAVIDDKPGIAELATGEPRIVNIFGSWCNPCIAEAPVIDALSARGIPVDGIAVRDTPSAVARFLAEHGDPFARIGDDPDSQAMLALGATGVPETWVIDAEGVVRAHHQGPMTQADAERLAQVWEALR